MNSLGGYTVNESLVCQHVISLTYRRNSDQARKLYSQHSGHFISSCLVAPVPGLKVGEVSAHTLSMHMNSLVPLALAPDVSAAECEVTPAIVT